MNEKPRLCVGALIFNNNEMLLLKSPKWDGKYVLPSGHVEFLEKIEDAVRREVKEETALELESLQFLKFIEFINPEVYYKKNLHFVGMQYLCKSTGRDVCINHEATDYLWVSPEQALDLNLEWGTKSIVEYYLKK